MSLKQSLYNAKNIILILPMSVVVMFGDGSDSSEFQFGHPQSSEYPYEMEKESWGQQHSGIIIFGIITMAIIISQLIRSKHREQIHRWEVLNTPTDCEFNEFDNKLLMDFKEDK